MLIRSSAIVGFNIDNCKKK